MNFIVTKLRKFFPEYDGCMKYVFLIDANERNKYSVEISTPKGMPTYNKKVYSLSSIDFSELIHNLFHDGYRVYK